MALARMLLGILAVFAVLIAPVSAACRAAMEARSEMTAHHDGAPEAAHACSDGEKSPVEVAAATHCAFLCSFFLDPTVGFSPVDFEQMRFSQFNLSMKGDALQPPAPPPRARLL